MGVCVHRIALVLLLAQLTSYCVRSNPDLGDKLAQAEPDAQVDIVSKSGRCGLGSCFSWLKPSEKESFRVEHCKTLNIDILPTRIQPKHYDLTFEVDVDQHQFSGRAKINIFVAKVEPTKQHSILNALVDLAKSHEIILHADESLQITGVKARQIPSNQKLKVTRICRKASMIKITLGERLANASAAQLDISFEAKIKRHQYDGLYESRQMRPDGSESDIVDILTQFEPMYARHVFPSFDEPRFKSTYKLRIMHPSHLTALSNTEVFKQEVDYSPGFTLTEFYTTPPTSSYLVAFAVGRYSHIERTINDGNLLIRVFTETGQSGKARASLQAAGDSLSFFEKYTGIRYPLSKLDILAADKFGLGAMENWGLITFKNSYLYYDPVYSTQVVETHMVKTVAHEIAHQWFGNLVTLNWWSELWLNEAFSEFFAYKASVAIRPDLDYDHFYLKSSLKPAFQGDSDPSAEPLQRENLITLDQVLSNFDVITYHKGAAVLRMLESLLGEEQWQKMIQNYLQAHQYSNVEPADFIKAVESLNTHIPIGEFFNSWFKQPGFPLVSIDLDASARRLTFIQTKFSTDATVDVDTTWYLPITVMFGDESGSREVKRTQTSKRQSSMDLPDWFEPMNQNHWVKVNQDFKGFYYVLYKSSVFTRLKVALAKQGSLSAADKYNLISEMNALMLSGRASTGDLINLIDWTVGEDDQQHGVVWSAVLDALKDLVAQSRSQSEKTAALKIAHGYLSAVLRRFGFRPSELYGSPSPSDELARPNVLVYLVQTGHADAVAEALAAFDTATGKPIDPNLAPVVYLAVGLHGSNEQFESLFSRFLSTPSPEDREAIAHAIVSAISMDRLRKSFNWIIKHDRDGELSILDSMLSSKEGQDFLIKMIKLCDSFNCSFIPSQLKDIVESID